MAGHIYSFELGVYSASSVIGFMVQCIKSYEEYVWLPVSVSGWFGAQCSVMPSSREELEQFVPEVWGVCRDVTWPWTGSLWRESWLQLLFLQTCVGGASSQVHCHLHGLKRGSAPDDSPHTRGPAALPPVFMQPHQCPEWDGWLWRGLQTRGVSQKGPLRCSHLCGGRTV